MEKMYLLWDNLQQQTVVGHLGNGHITDDPEGIIILGMWKPMEM